MTEEDIPLPDAVASAAVPEIVERACADAGLILTRKSTLASFAGCVHWHFKKGKERGTLEVTWWERGNRLWFKVASGRTGEWIAETLPRLTKCIKDDLSDKSGEGRERCFVE